MMQPMSSRPPATGNPDEPLELPALDVEEPVEGSSDTEDGELSLPAIDGDEDDETADELNVDWGLDYSDATSSALDDDATGIEEGPATLGITLQERTGSLLGADDELGCDDSHSLGIDELPEAKDRTDLDGLDDPGALVVDENRLPELDGSEEDDSGEIDVGIHLADLPEAPESG